MGWTDVGLTSLAELFAGTELKDQSYVGAPLELELPLPSSVTVVLTFPFWSGPALAAGNWPPAACDCVEFGDVLLVHPATRTVATTTTAVTPVKVSFFDAMVSLSSGASALCLGLLELAWLVK